MKRIHINNNLYGKAYRIIWVFIILITSIGLTGCLSSNQDTLKSTLSEQDAELETSNEQEISKQGQVKSKSESDEPKDEPTEKLKDEPTENKETKKEGGFELTALQEDVDKLKQYIQNKHPMLFTDKEALDVLLVEQYKKIEEGMTLLEFYRVVAPIVSQLRCGHTFIGLSDSDFEKFIDTSLFLPFNLYWYNGKAYVTQNNLVPGLPLGAEVISINNIPMIEIIDGLYSNTGADGTNETSKKRAINAGFRYHYALDNDITEQITVIYREKDTTTKRELIAQAVTKKDIDSSGDDFWFELSHNSRSNSTLFDDEYALLRMATFYPYGSESVASFNTFIDGFFEEVEHHKVENIIIDVRDNFGGDPYVAAHLLSYLEKEPITYFVEGTPYYSSLTKPLAKAEKSFEGNIYVLMNGNSFSTTGHFLALLKYHQIGTLIGEESGGSYACTDASSSTTLENTALQFRYSTIIFAVDVEGFTPGRGIMPDVPVEIDYEALMSEEDIEMGIAKRLIHGVKE